MTIYIHFRTAGRITVKLHNVSAVEHIDAHSIRTRNLFSDTASYFGDVKNVAIEWSN